MINVVQRNKIIIEAYAKRLIALERSVSRGWSDGELPYPRKVIKDAILNELTFIGSSPTNENQDMRRMLITVFIKLAFFIPADDAQVLSNADKILAEGSLKEFPNQSSRTERYEMLRRIEKPVMRINKMMTRDARFLIAEIAAFNSGARIEIDGNGVKLRFLNRNEF